MKSHEDTRHLPVPLTEAELLDFGQQLARACSDHERAESQRKLTAAQLKGDVDAKAAMVERLTSIVSSKEEVRKVDCLWLMNNPKPGQKSLVRLDTHASIEQRDMTGEDVQGELELEESEPPENDQDADLKRHRDLAPTVEAAADRALSKRGGKGK